MKTLNRDTKREMFAHYEAWKQSGIGQRDYCRQHAISYTTFKYWVVKYNKENPKASKPGFVPVKIKPNPEHEVQTPTGQLHFLFPNGVQMRCPETIDSNLLKHLINS
jgi:hypothetical protein